MKKKGLLLIAFLLLLVVFANAQHYNSYNPYNPLAVENQYPGNRDAVEIYQRVVRTLPDSTVRASKATWVTNRFQDNWFISVGGGFAQLMGEETRYMDLKDQLQPTLTFSLGKWISPVWGIRLNVTGSKLQGFANWFESPDGVGQGFGSWYIGENPKYAIPGFSATNNHIQAHYQDGEHNKLGREVIFDRFLKGGKQFDKEENGGVSMGGYGYKFTYAGASIDFLLDLKHLFTSYNSKSVFNPVLYGGVGYAHTFQEGDRTAINNIMGKGGLQLNFRLSNRWQFYLDGQLLLLPEVFDYRTGGDKTQDGVGNYTIGLTYRMNFQHFMKPALIDPRELEMLNREINELRNRPAVVCPQCPPAAVVNCPEPTTIVREREYGRDYDKNKFALTPVFFTLDSYVVRDNQLYSITQAAQYLKTHPNSTLQIASYADRKTGNPESNVILSRNRSNAVANVLVNRFGIDRSRLDLTYFGDRVQPFDVNEWNRVSIFIIP